MRFLSPALLGEPFPVYYVNGLPKMIDATFANHLPEVEKYLPTEDGLPPLGMLRFGLDTKIIKL
jgi:leucyl-tRNA synthetase